MCELKSPKAEVLPPTYLQRFRHVPLLSHEVGEFRHGDDCFACARGYCLRIPQVVKGSVAEKDVVCIDLLQVHIRPRIVAHEGVNPDIGGPCLTVPCSVAVERELHLSPFLVYSARGVLFLSAAHCLFLLRSVAARLSREVRINKPDVLSLGCSGGHSPGYHPGLSLIHISEPTRLRRISYA